jgi:hypothetical protein
MNSSKKRFVICIDNTDYEASLILRKLYEIIPDARAEKDDFFRIIDESGEDYLYHQSYFIVINLSSDVERALSSVSVHQ